MAEQAEQVSTSGLVDTKRPKRRQYSEALKRQMVAETQALGERQCGLVKEYGFDRFKVRRQWARLRRV
jgi:hypothetical protein